MENVPTHSIDELQSEDVKQISHFLANQYINPRGPKNTKKLKILISVFL